MNFRSLFLAVVCVFVPLVQAQPVDVAVTLPDGRFDLLQRALDQAMRQSPRMLQSSVGLARADADLIQAKSYRLPSLAGNARMAHESVATTDTPTSTGDGFYYQLNFTQPLFRWGEIKNRVEIGELGRKIAQKSYAEAYRDLSILIRREFFSLILAKRNLLQLRHDLELKNRAHEIDRTRRDNGQISNIDYGVREIDLQEATFALERSEYTFTQTVNSFCRLTGLATVSEDQIPEDIPAPTVEEGQALRLVLQFDQRDGAKDLPSVEILKSMARQGQLNYNIARTRLLPKFEFGAASSLENQTFLSGNAINQSATTRRSVSIVANWTIFDGFSARADKRRSLSEKRDAELKLQFLLQNLDDQKQAGVKQFDFAVKGLAYAERRLSMARNGLTYMEQEVKAGRQSESAIEGAKNILRASEAAVLAGRIDVYGQWTALVSLLGMDPAVQKLPLSYTSNGK